MVRFLRIALGSATETEYYLLLARDLGYLKEQECDRMTAETIEVKRMLNTFIRRLKASE